MQRSPFKQSIGTLVHFIRTSGIATPSEALNYPTQASHAPLGVDPHVSHFSLSYDDPQPLLQAFVSRNMQSLDTPINLCHSLADFPTLKAMVSKAPLIHTTTPETSGNHAFDDDVFWDDGLQVSSGVHLLPNTPYCAREGSLVDDLFSGTQPSPTEDVSDNVPWYHDDTLIPLVLQQSSLAPPCAKFESWMLVELIGSSGRPLEETPWKCMFCTHINDGWMNCHWCEGDRSLYDTMFPP